MYLLRFEGNDVNMYELIRSNFKQLVERKRSYAIEWRAECRSIEDWN